MFEVITADGISANGDAIASMHRLRCRVFKDRLKWPVTVINGMEFDQFDNNHAHYLVMKNEHDDVVATCRLIPTNRPYLLGDVFTHMIDGEIPRSSQIWEMTRFAADTKAASSPAKMMETLTIAILEFGLQNGITNYVSVSDIRMENIFRKVGWHPTRLGNVFKTGTDSSAGEIFDVTPEILKVVRQKAGIQETVIKTNQSQYKKVQH